jgi:hypothetical protein
VRFVRIGGRLSQLDLGVAGARDIAPDAAALNACPSGLVDRSSAKGLQFDHSSGSID